MGKLEPPAGSITIPQGDQWIDDVARAAQAYKVNAASCTQSIVAAFLDVFGRREPMVLRAATAFTAGMFSSLTCGIHAGGIIVLGLVAGREDITDGLDGLLPVVQPAQEMVRRINRRIGGHDCREMTGVDFTDLEQAMAYHGSPAAEECTRRIHDGAEEIARVLSELDAAGELIIRSPQPRRRGAESA